MIRRLFPINRRNRSFQREKALQALYATDVLESDRLPFHQLEYLLNRGNNKEVVYTTFMGQLFYFEGQKESIKRFLCGIEHIFSIYFSILWEEPESDLTGCLKLLESLLRGEYENLDSDIPDNEMVEVPEDKGDFALALVKGVKSKGSSLDRIISRYSINWSINRISRIDHNIMRLAIYELLFMNDIPHSVTPNEAVEMAKNFGGEKSSKFINGILGKVIEELFSGNLDL